jgi:hypothetical protein
MSQILNLTPENTDQRTLVNIPYGSKSITNLTQQRTIKQWHDQSYSHEESNNVLSTDKYAGLYTEINC